MAGSVVVGIDGSEDSAAALRWALRYAAEHGVSTRVVHVWTPLPGFNELTARQRERLSADLSRSAEQAIERTERALRDLDPPPGGVAAGVAEGVPGVALVELSRDALLLVVGATGRGGRTAVRQPRVGATARYVTRHARCPVTVVGCHRNPAPVELPPIRTVRIRPTVPTARVG